MLETLFKLRERGTNIKTEFVAGYTTFMAMSYIIFVNPDILSNAGMDPGAVFVATCLASAIGCLIMGLYANFPIAIAPGMGLNAFFTYAVVIGMGLTWQHALMAVFLSGAAFVTLSLLPIREWIINIIPTELKMAISGGIGLFLIIIGMSSIGLVVDNPATLVGQGSLQTPTFLLATLCFIIICAAEARKIPGAILIGMLSITALGAVLGVSEVSGIMSLPPSIAPGFLALDWTISYDLGLLIIVLSLLFVDMFDTAGTMVGVAHKANMLDKDGKIPGLKKALLADSTATMIGAALGTSSSTSYVESVAGVKAGGRTGLTAVTVAVLFLIALFFAPLASAIQSYATGPALIYVGCVMMSGLVKINWDEPTSFVPAVITVAAMPFTYSIATGIGLGFVSFVVLKLAAGKWKELNVGFAFLAGLFLLKFAFLSGG